MNHEIFKEVVDNHLSKKQKIVANKIFSFDLQIKLLHYAPFFSLIIFSTILFTIALVIEKSLGKNFLNMSSLGIFVLAIPPTTFLDKKLFQPLLNRLREKEAEYIRQNASDVT